MPRKVILIADPGIDTAFAIAIALNDPNLEVVALIPCAGNVSAAQATVNVHVILDQIDPPRRPRTSAAVPVEYDRDGTSLHGPNGLGGVEFPVLERHSPPAAEKLIAEVVRANPHEVSVIVLGPATTLARAFAVDPELPGLLDRLVLVGGAWREPGNAGPVAEFHFALDPDAARKMLHVGVHPTIVPLDLTRKLLYSPTELLGLPNADSCTGKFLRQVVPYGIRASSQIYGVEGFHLKDVLGIAALALPGAVRAVPHVVEVETHGKFTRGMMVVDDRVTPAGRPNAQVGIDAAVGEVRQYVTQVLKAAS